MERSPIRRLPYLPALVIALFAIIVSTGTGSVRIAPKDILAILGHALWQYPLPQHIPETLAGVLVSIRIPRALSAFLVGGMLSVSGAVMQALLQNPLASSYTLGVSSGAAFGASLVVAFEISIPVLGFFLLPFAGFSFALLTTLFVLAFSARMDRNVQSHTVILLGMVVSLFMSALVTLVSTLNPEHINRILMWQMGSFAGRRWIHAEILFLCALYGVLRLLSFHRELDILSFGDAPSLSIGVSVPAVKKRTLALASLMTGVAVCFTGTIGFVDLIVPHTVRRLYGPAHKRLLPLSFLYGGAFLTLTDTLSRTVFSPREIPVGAVTAFLGTPFFLYLYFGGRRR